MTAFWKKGDEDKRSANKQATKKTTIKSKSSKKAEKSSKKNKGLVVPGEKAELINKVLIKPMISEAVMNAQELGKYTFKVAKSATKNEVALAVEALYKVSVLKVNIMNYKPENKFFRGRKGSKSGYKKAIVTLVAGDKIKLFS